MIQNRVSVSHISGFGTSEMASGQKQPEQDELHLDSVVSDNLTEGIINVFKPCVEEIDERVRLVR